MTWLAGMLDATPPGTAEGFATAPSHGALSNWPAAVLLTHWTVRRETDVPQVVAAVRRFCIANGHTPLLAAHVATAASELANNLWMHALTAGQIGVAAGVAGRRPAVLLQAGDAGPGISDLKLALQEGWSSAGGMGCGLPGVQRLMDEFEIRSAPGLGTRVRALKWGAAPALGKFSP